MAKTKPPFPPFVGISTDYENKSVKVHIVGPNGNMMLHVYAEHTFFVIRDPIVGSQKCKGVCELSANGHFKGWFVAKEGATPSGNTLAWFPARKPRKRAAKAKQTKH